MFTKAERIWLRGLSKEMNIEARFTAEIEIPRNAQLHITGATFYKVYLDGELIHHGPAPTGTGFARVDVIELPRSRGKVSLSIEVAGYASNSYATVKEESYVIAEVVSGGDVISYTGRDFRAYRVGGRIQKSLRYSGQRHFSELWDISVRDEECEIDILPKEITYLPRRAPLPRLDKEIPNQAFCKGKFTLLQNFDEKNRNLITMSRTACRQRPSNFRDFNSFLLL